MGYLTGYLSLGVLVLIAIGADNLVRRRGRAYKLGKLAQQLRRRRQSLLSIVIERIAAPIAVAIGIIVAWPLAAVFAIHFFRKRAEASDHVEASRVKAFCVEREHLIEPVTLEDIERRELVFDPLVPGHGNETALCAGYAANLNSVAASVSRPFCSALI